MELYGIETLQLNGDMSIAQRTQVSDKFRSSDRDSARVLLLSSVGMTGLNLPCAHILIMLVRNGCPRFRIPV